MDGIKRRIGYTRLSRKHQVTIPASVVAQTGADVGTEFKVEGRPDGRIVLLPIENLRARHLRAIEETAGTMADVWQPGELKRLRDEWR